MTKNSKFKPKKHFYFNEDRMNLAPDRREMTFDNETDAREWGIFKGFKDLWSWVFVSSDSDAKKHSKERDL